MLAYTLKNANSDIFMLCVFIEMQACENERIYGCLKIVNTNRKIKLNMFFVPKNTKKNL